jgi:superoxide oxidase
MMTALNTLEKNGGLPSSQGSNLHANSIPTRTSFDRVTIALHWITLILVLGLLTTALLHAKTHDDAAKAVLLQIHRSFGVTVWVTTALRLFWRMTKAQLPPFASDMGNLHRHAVQKSEYCLYALLLVQPLSGVATTITRGRAFDLFWWHIPPLMQHYPAVQLAFFRGHRIGAWTLMLLIAGHATNALVHDFVLRDNLLRRMLPAIRNRQHAVF